MSVGGRPPENAFSGYEPSLCAKNRAYRIKKDAFHEWKNVLRPPRSYYSAALKLYTLKILFSIFTVSLTSFSISSEGLYAKGASSSVALPTVEE